MNFRKFISGVSALTIAASAFAGMAVTASAADTTKTPVYTGSYSASTTDISPWVFASGNSTYPASYEATADGITVTSGWSGSRTRNGYITNTFTNALSGDISISMVVKFNSDYNAKDLADRNPQIHILDGDGADIIWFAEDGQGGKVYVDGVAVTDSDTARYRASTWTLNVDINTSSKTLSYSATTVGLSKNGSFSGTKAISAGAVGGLRVRSGENVAKNGEGKVSLTSYSVWQDAITDTYNNYTIQYQDKNGNTIREAATGRSGVTTSTIEPLESDTATFYSADGSKKYVYDESASTIPTIAADDSSVAVLVFDTYEKATHEINAYATINGVSTVIKSDSKSGYSDEADYTYGPYAYIEYPANSGTYYKYNNVNATDGSVPSVAVSNQNSDEIVLNYALAENVVYYAEAENYSSYESKGFAFSGNSSIASGGYAAGCTQGTSVFKYDFDAGVAGTYKLTVNAVGRPGTGTRSTYISLTGSTDKTTALTSNGNALTQSVTKHFDANTSNTAYLIGNGGNGVTLDYVVVELVTADPTAEATLVEDNITDDENYKGDDADSNAVFSVFQATVTPGTNAVKSVKFTLNNAASETNEYTSEGFSGEAIFALIVPMASANVSDITAVIDNTSYTAYTVE